MDQKVYLYPVYLRLWHLLNALFFLVLILTGLSMQYSDPSAPWISLYLADRMAKHLGTALPAMVNNTGYSGKVCGNA